uniref:G protein-coupled receptor 37 like 1 n=1 Tax=Astyanax mexicanus TaxID=7994 RepID=A0A3B1K447_ASTMX
VHNPLYPVTDDSYGAYAVMLLSLVVFAVGVVGNLAVMCIVWHNYYLKNTWNCVLASMAFWDFIVLFFCLPVVIFNELTKRRLMGDLSCRLVPYVEVTSLGVFTFSLCALSIDRFHRLTGAPSRPLQQQQVESCGSIVAKLSVVWFGSLLLAIPELLLWQMDSEVSAVSGLPVDSCARRPAAALPEAVYSLVLTYHEARMWWSFGCFFCLPLLFSLACRLLTNHMVEENLRQTRLEEQMSRMLTMLTIVYGLCCLPEHAWSIGLTYASLQISKNTLALLALIGQFLMFCRYEVPSIPLLLNTSAPKSTLSITENAVGCTVEYTVSAS